MHKKLISIRQQKKRKAFAIPTALIILVALAILTSAALLTSRLDRASAHNISNHIQARNAANDGVEAAKLKLLELFNSLSVPGHFALAEVVSPSFATQGYNKNDVDNHFSFLELEALNANSPNLPQITKTTELRTPVTSPHGTALIPLDNRDFNRKAGIIQLVNELDPAQKSHHSFWILDASSRLDALQHGLQSRTETADDIRQIPLLTHDQVVLPIFDRSNALSTSTLNLIRPAPPATTTGQFAGDNKAGDHLYSMTPTSTPLAPNGRPRLNLKKLKDYVDELDPSQNSAPPFYNLRAKVVYGLVDPNDPRADNSANWGGGDLTFLVTGLGYTKQEALIIAANLVDFLDEDMIPTVSNINDLEPEFFGTEGRLSANGKTIGHPYINYLGTGIILNYSNASNPAINGLLNSSLFICSIGVINPWEEPTLMFYDTSLFNNNFSDMRIERDRTNASFFHSYRITNLEFEHSGTVTNGNRGTNIYNYLGTRPNNDLGGFFGMFIPYPNNISPNSGKTVPHPWNNSSAYLERTRFEPNDRQPKDTTFNNVRHKIKDLTLTYKEDKGKWRNYEGVIQRVREYDIIHSPATFNRSTSSSAPIIMRPGGRPNAIGERPNEVQHLHLVTDPRLHFKRNAWALHKNVAIHNVTEPETLTPNATINYYGSNPWDGDQLIPNNSRWWSQPNGTKNHFFVRSDLKSAGETAWLFAGRPFRTLRMFNEAPADWRLLGYLDAGIFPPTASITHPTWGTASAQAYKSLINVNTKDRAAIKALLANIQNWGSQPNLDAAVDYFLNQLSSTNKKLVNYSQFYEFFDSNAILGPTILHREKERPVIGTANALTHNSTSFVVYSRGANVTPSGKETASVVMKSRIQLKYDNQTRRYKIEELSRETL